MRMRNTNVFIFMLFLFGQCSGRSLSYDEIISLNVTCAPFNTCAQRRGLESDNLLLQACECKQSCTRYGTCCIDSPYNTQYDRRVSSSLQETCESFMGTKYSIYAKTKCKRNWDGDEEIKSLCESNMYGLSDPISVLPVTNVRTNVTYRNYFCGLCNDDDADENLVFWTINVKIFSKPIELSDNENTYGRHQYIQNLTYNNGTNQWGIMVSMKDDDLMTTPGSTERRTAKKDVFQAVSLTFHWPSRVQNAITICEANLVSKCHPNWKDKDIEDKCHSYMGMIYNDFITDGGYSITQKFRNIHCAICNFVYNLSNLDCKEEIPELTSTRPPYLSFTLLLDINPSGGERVGETNRCISGEVFDPFFKKCRVLRCIKPGYKVRNRKCVPP